MRRALAAAALVLAAACGHRTSSGAMAPARPAPAHPDPRFATDRSVPLEVRISSSSKRGEVTLEELTFRGADPQGGPALATRVVPPGQGPFAAVLWVHWLGDPATTNRSEFLEEAVALASEGCVSLLIDGVWATPNWFERRVVERDLDTSLRQVRDIRRALDVLSAQPGVDGGRIGYVGHDFGAMYGVLAGSADGRPKTYVLAAGEPLFSDWMLLGPQPRDRADYLRTIETLDPVKFVGSLNASILFQFAAHDRFVSPAAAEAFAAAAREPKTVKTYDTGHALGVPAAAADRAAWLTRELR